MANETLVAERGSAIESASANQQTHKRPLAIESSNTKRDQFEVHTSDDESANEREKKKQKISHAVASKGDIEPLAASNGEIDHDCLAIENDEQFLSNDLSISFDNDDCVTENSSEQTPVNLSVTVRNSPNKVQSVVTVPPPNSCNHRQSHTNKNVHFEQRPPHANAPQFQCNKQHECRPNQYVQPQQNRQAHFEQPNPKFQRAAPADSSCQCRGQCCANKFRPSKSHFQPKREVKVHTQAARHCSTVVRANTHQGEAQQPQSTNVSSGHVTLSFEEFGKIIGKNQVPQTVTIQNGQVTLPAETFKDLVINQPPKFKRNRLGHGQRVRMQRAADNQKKNAGFEHWYKNE